MRLPPLGRRRKPGNVATGAPGRGRASPFAARPARFDCLPASGWAPAFFPAEAESGEPGMANFWFGAGGGFGVCARANEPHARAATQLPVQSMRQCDANITASRPRSRLRRQILPLPDDRLAERAPQLVLPLPRLGGETVRAAPELARDALDGGFTRRARELVGLRGHDEDARSGPRGAAMRFLGSAQELEEVPFFVFRAATDVD